MTAAYALAPCDDSASVPSSSASTPLSTWAFRARTSGAGLTRSALVRQAAKEEM